MKTKTAMTRAGAFVEVSMRGLNHRAARRRDFYICLVAFGLPAVGVMLGAMTAITWAVR